LSSAHTRAAIGGGRRAPTAIEITGACHEAIYHRSGLPTVARVGSTRYLQLTYDELRHKLDWCAKASDFENVRNLGFPRPNPEAFSGHDVLLPDRFIG